MTARWVTHVDLALADRGAGVLVLGTGRGVVAEELRRAGHAVESTSGDWPSIQLARRFAVVVVEHESSPPADGGAAIVHCAVQHVLPGGLVVVCDDVADGDEAAVRAVRFDLDVVDVTVVEGGRIVVHRRTQRHTIHDMVFAARARIGRVEPHDLAARLASDAAPLVLDTRTHTDRVRFGVIAGALHVPRTVLEWHLDPANGYRHPAVESFEQPLVVVCNGGYSSSLAAASLLDLGFTDVCDLVGGHRAWLAAGLPVTEPDHSHLDL